jgi:nitroimidazol reductase NimA-like FMN-containing flavoprotein (pyridoxamine 5'-phosphate oxidase superfamily)
MIGAPAAPRFRTLSRQECEVILARNYVGRFAFARGEQIDIIPLHYVFVNEGNGFICMRTAEGTRVEESGNSFGSWPAAFEIDEVEGLFSWRSVVVHGRFHAASPGNKDWQANPERWEKAAGSFRTLIPDAFTDTDPTLFRYMLVRLEVSEISGREATTE